ncbi:hypothetical protein cypCar_00019439 [Cyprinus carpio]|nr:hypothetical protein cypCar_00019439 [Cyprinus carpio]
MVTLLFKQGLKMTGLGLGLEIQIKEIPVSYAKSQQVLDDIWQTMTPKVVIHLGIAQGAKCIKLEQIGKIQGWKGCLASPEKLVPQLQSIIQALLSQLDCPEHTTSGYMDSRQICNLQVTK